MAFMYVSDRLDVKSRDTLLRIRKAHMRLNVTSVFDTMRLIPSWCSMSFTQPKLEKEKKLRPSQSLMPKFDYTSMKYDNDLARSKDFLATPVKEFIRRFRP